MKNAHRFSFLALISFGLVVFGMSACASPSAPSARGTLGSVKPLRRAKRKILVHGHRGSRGTRPENTMPAFKDGVAAGVDFLELDLHFTKDNVLVISHDPDITGEKCRDADGERVQSPVLIRDLTLAELQKYDCGSVRLPDFPEQVLVPHTPRPTFEELVKWVSQAAPRVGLNIETKMDEPSSALMPDPHFFAAQIITILEKYHRVGKDLLQSFDPSTLVESKKIEPALRTVYLFEAPPDGQTFCQAAKAIGAAAISPEWDRLAEDDVTECHGLGLDVVPWTPDTEDAWASLIDLGVDAIITDYPKKLIDYLAK